MANEILKDEQLTDEQLEQVAGGTIDELQKDVNFLEDIGLVKKHNHQPVDLVAIAIADVFADTGVKLVFHPEDPNEYIIDGKQVTRKQALQHVLDVKHMRTNLDKYM